MALKKEKIDSWYPANSCTSVSVVCALSLMLSASGIDLVRSSRPSFLFIGSIFNPFAAGAISPWYLESLLVINIQPLLGMNSSLEFRKASISSALSRKSIHSDAIYSRCSRVLSIRVCSWPLELITVGSDSHKGFKIFE
jgi:hypothetical protein